ncbi:FtsW/RodA/SpoVE family cell cycle protein [Anaerolineales bacterium HSG24]|nr:FtsW/RodA/SpoVE family cell cycle protein [Anaerolineales bacterium HSG24]
MPSILLLLACLFTGVAFLQLSLVNDNLSITAFIPLIILSGCGGMVSLILTRRGRSGNPILWPTIMLLSGLGLAFTARLAPNFLMRQMIWLVLASILFLLINLLPRDLDWLRHYKYGWFLGGLTLLATTLLFGVNPSGYGARLWLQVGNVYFQPSEPLKLCLIVFLAAYMADRHRQLAQARAYIGPMRLPHPSYWLPMLFMWGLSIILLVWQRDLGAALLFFGTFIGLVYVATGQVRYLFAGTGLMSLAAVIGYYQFAVVRLRVMAFLNPWPDSADRAFQIVQSLLAFASGGFLGQGLGQGLPTAIPVVHTDFVFAAIGEEYGLVGTLAILFCFMLLVSQAIQISLTASNRFEQLLATGIGLMLGLQTLVITAGTLKLMPLTGVTLPFVSYGGSSLLTSFIMVGLLLFISTNSPTHHWRRAPFVHAQLHLAGALLTGFLIVAGGLILWQIILAPFLNQRRDNPRPVIAAQQIQRGAIFAADGTPLVESLVDEDGLAQRLYHYPSLAPLTGYYSLRYGVGETEARFDSSLRGADGQTAQSIYLNDLLHQPIVGKPITLTVELPAQLIADEALAPYAGAIVVLEIETGNIMVMSSNPTYDPNRLDEKWDQLREDKQSPLINRAAQGLFAVGDLARLIGLVARHESGTVLPDNPTSIPLSELLDRVGEVGYLGTAHQLQLTRGLRNINSQVGRLPDFDEQGTVGGLAVSPLHLARFIAALEQDGRLPEPRLSEQTSISLQQVMKPQTAQAVRAMFPQIDEQLIGLTGQASPDETGQSSHVSWFVGLGPTTASPVSESASPPDLIFDPNKIKPTPQASTFNPPEQPAPAQYAIVIVFVSEQAMPEQVTHIGLEVMGAIRGNRD